MSASTNPLTPLAAEQRAMFDWLVAPYLVAVIAALESAEPNCARFVGGCVRDSLLGAPPKDFDVATTLEPGAVIAALKAAGLRAAPTGLDHGTVTAIADHHGVEVTTLRADISTDGRRASVAFTRDWAVDAGRRDFRINAIYLTPDGKLYDPVGGVADAAAKRVRFIGPPEQRIREDFLRILRFFRFSARFCDEFDQQGLAACAARSEGIAHLSAERVGAEFMNILSLPRASFALTAMRDSGVLSEVWPAEPDIGAVEALKKITPGAPPPVALGALYGDAGAGAGRRLRLSNAEKAIRSNALKGEAQITPNLPETRLRELIYRLGKDVFQDAAALSTAFRRIPENEHQRLITLVNSWAPPELVVSGRHIIDAGVPAGPDVARILRTIEDQWIAEGFPGQDRVNVILRECVNKYI